MDRNGHPARLIVGYDHHPASHRAVLTAAALAPALNASLVLLHVISLADYPPDPELRDWEARSADALKAHLTQAQWLLAGTEVPWQYRTVRGDAARAIAQHASDTDALLIVVGAGSSRITSRLRHTSVPAELARIQRIPVLVVPAPA